MHSPGTDGTVVVVGQCQLRLGNEPWDYASRQAAAIDAHWARRLEDNPAFFNGIVYLTSGYDIVDGSLIGRCLKAEFKSYLYWREHGQPPGIVDAFGSALIVSADGAVLLGRQRSGNLNGNLSYSPSGLIDAQDVRADGSIDIAASIRRELAEETGVSAGDVAEVPGFVVTRAGAQMSIAREFRSTLSADALRQRIRSALAADPQSELEDIVIVRSSAEAQALATPAFMQVLLAHYFSSGPRPA